MRSATGFSGCFKLAHPLFHEAERKREEQTLRRVCRFPRLRLQTAAFQARRRRSLPSVHAESSCAFAQRQRKNNSCRMSDGSPVPGHVCTARSSPAPRVRKTDLPVFSPLATQSLQSPNRAAARRYKPRGAGSPARFACDFESKRGVFPPVKTARSA